LRLEEEEKEEEKEEENFIFHIKTTYSVRVINLIQM